MLFLSKQHKCILFKYQQSWQKSMDRWPIFAFACCGWIYDQVVQFVSAYGSSCCKRMINFFVEFTWDGSCLLSCSCCRCEDDLCSCCCDMGGAAEAAWPTDCEEERAGWSEGLPPPRLRRFLLVTLVKALKFSVDLLTWKKEVMLKRRNRVISLSMPKFAKSCAQNASVICVVSLPVIHCIWMWHVF